MWYTFNNQLQIGNLEEDIDQRKSTESNLKSQIQSLEKLAESNKTINETLSHSIMTEDNSQLMNELGSLQTENVRTEYLLLKKRVGKPTITKQLYVICINWTVSTAIFLLNFLYSQHAWNWHVCPKLTLDGSHSRFRYVNFNNLMLQVI